LEKETNCKQTPYNIIIPPHRKYVAALPTIYSFSIGERILKIG